MSSVFMVHTYIHMHVLVHTCTYTAFIHSLLLSPSQSLSTTIPSIHASIHPCARLDGRSLSPSDLSSSSFLDPTFTTGTTRYNKHDRCSLPWNQMLSTSWQLVYPYPCCSMLVHVNGTFSDLMYF